MALYIREINLETLTDNMNPPHVTFRSLAYPFFLDRTF